MRTNDGQYLPVSGLGLRLANLQTDCGPALGVETPAGVVNVTRTGIALRMPAPIDVDDLLQNERAAEVRDILAAATANEAAVVITPKVQTQFAPLVTRPEKIICVGFNYREHAAETGAPVPKAPPLFSKFNNALNYHNGTVHLPTRVAREFDYETELVLVFGQKCRDVAETDALKVLAGYTIGNDISARELQQQTSQFLAGKMSDGFAPLGPWLVTANSIPDPNSLWLRTTVNGEVRQDWNTKDMIFDCRKLISFVSSIMTINPGDILFTGTPQGVILGHKEPREERRWLRAGDEIVSEIEGLGGLQVVLPLSKRSASSMAALRVSRTRRSTHLA